MPPAKVPHFCVAGCWCHLVHGTVLSIRRVFPPAVPVPSMSVLPEGTGGSWQAEGAVQTGCASIAAIRPSHFQHSPSLLTAKKSWWVEEEFRQQRINIIHQSHVDAVWCWDPISTHSPLMLAEILWRGGWCRISRECWRSPPLGSLLLALLRALSSWQRTGHEQKVWRCTLGAAGRITPATPPAALSP